MRLSSVAGWMVSVNPAAFREEPMGPAMVIHLLR